jgi:hypothetical protein
MADVQNIITKGIGSAPGNIRYFVLFGLDVNPINIVPIALTALTLQPRSVSMTVQARDTDLELQSRPVALTLQSRDP